MIEAVSNSIAQLAIGIGFILVGCVLFFVGNRLFGRKTGGKRLVVFATGIAGGFLGYIIFREAFSKSDSSVFLMILGSICVMLSCSFMIAAFASEEGVEKAFKILLRS